jgi:acyl-CoA synthetase (AMP-forming)/AMP-acid ligase II
MDIILRSLRRCRSLELVDAIALDRRDGLKCTYEQLLHGADAMRAGISKAVRPTIDSQYGPRIACLMDPGPSFVVSMWCTWMSKGIFLPLSPSHPPAVLEHAVHDSGASVVRFITSVASEVTLQVLWLHQAGSSRCAASGGEEVQLPSRKVSESWRDDACS